MKKMFSFCCCFAIIATMCLSCVNKFGPLVDAQTEAELSSLLEGSWREAFGDTGFCVYQTLDEAQKAAEEYDVRKAYDGYVYVFLNHDNQLYYTENRVKLDRPLARIYEDISYWKATFHRNKEDITIVGELFKMTSFFKLVEWSDSYFIYRGSDGYHLCQRIASVNEINDYVNAYIEKNNTEKCWLLYKKQELSDGKVVKEETFTEDEMMAFREELKINQYMRLDGDVEVNVPLLTYGTYQTATNTFTQKGRSNELKIGLSSYDVGAEIYFSFTESMYLDPSLKQIKRFRLVEMTDTGCVLYCEKNTGEPDMLVYLRGI